MKKTTTDPNISCFLGIGTGKRVKAKAEAARLKAEEERKTLQLKADLAASGYKSTDEKKVEAEVTAKTIEAQTKAADTQSNTTLYYVIGGIVAVVIIALIIIKKR